VVALLLLLSLSCSPVSLLALLALSSPSALLLSSQVSLVRDGGGRCVGCRECGLEIQRSRRRLRGCGRGGAGVECSNEDAACGVVWPRAFWPRCARPSPQAVKTLEIEAKINAAKPRHARNACAVTMHSAHFCHFRNQTANRKSNESAPVILNCWVAQGEERCRVRLLEGGTRWKQRASSDCDPMTNRHPASLANRCASLQLPRCNQSWR
jgi:hypothetical protein